MALAFRNNANRLSNGLSSDRVITSDHDNLDTSRTALGDGVWNGGTRWIDHRYQADETKTGQREVGIIGVEVESLNKLPIV